MMMDSQEVEQEYHELKAWLVFYSAFEGIDGGWTVVRGKYHVDQYG